jgi:hypothetical protein
MMTVEGCEMKSLASLHMPQETLENLENDANFTTFSKLVPF